MSEQLYVLWSVSAMVTDIAKQLCSISGHMSETMLVRREESRRALFSQTGGGRNSQGAGCSKKLTRRQ